MSCFLVPIIFWSPLGLIIAVVKLQNIITVSCFNMNLKTSLCCSLIITLIARMLDTFMFRLNTCLKMALLCSLIVTLITMILDIFMFRLNLCLKISLLCSLIITETDQSNIQPNFLKVSCITEKIFFL